MFYPELIKRQLCHLKLVLWYFANLPAFWPLPQKHVVSTRGSSQQREWTWVSCIAGRFTIWATTEVGYSRKIIPYINPSHIDGWLVNSFITADSSMFPRTQQKTEFQPTRVTLSCWNIRYWGRAGKGGHTFAQKTFIILLKSYDR